MPVTFLLTALATVTLVALLWSGERGGSARARWLLKPLTSALFLVVALLEGPRDAFDRLVFAGLMLSAIGDVALIPRGRRWFLSGLVAFLLGHVAYVAAFNLRAPVASLHPAMLGVLVLAATWVFLYLRPHLGAMLVPVVAYMLVITLMLAGALAVASAHSHPAGWRLALAAGMFYISDVTVARDRFVTGPRFANRVAGLPLYYAAQFLFALSIGG